MGIGVYLFFFVRQDQDLDQINCVAENLDLDAIMSQAGYPDPIKSTEDPKHRKNYRLPS